MTESSPYLLREYQPGDEHAILEAFNRVFAKVDPNFEPRDLASWHWQYLANPSGWRIFLAVHADGRVVAQYAGVPQRMQLEGQPGLFSQSIDSLTDPEFRRGLAKVPLFVQVGRAYEQRYGGQPPERDSLMWGLPVPIAWRIGKRQLKYELMRTQDKLVLEQSRWPSPAAPGVETLELSRFAAQDGEFAARVSSARAAIAVRDAAQLNWRFAEHPTRRYRLLRALRAGATCGLAVFRRAPFDGSEDGLVCDFLTAPEDQAAREALLETLVHWTRASGAQRLVAVFPDTAPEFLEFQRLGFRVHASRYFVVGCSFQRRQSLRWLYYHWYYTLGDTDLC